MSQIPNKKYTGLEDRLRKNSEDIPGPCLTPCRVWSGYKQNGMKLGEGYGKINLFTTLPSDKPDKRGRRGRSRKFAVHRISKILAEITIVQPDFDFRNRVHRKSFFDLVYAYHLSGLTIDHLCGNPACLNPSHLEWVRMDQNQRRKYWNKGRKAKRVGKVHLHQTRHAQTVKRSESVEHFLQKIRAKVYRKKI